VPPKSIAVPANPSARKGRRLPTVAVSHPDVDADTEGYEVATLAPRPPRALRARPEHRYRLGERLRMVGGGNLVARAPSFCKVIAQLPDEGRGALLYRVRSDSEQFERIVAEADLSRT
jgi:hypothetical protein